MLHAVLRQFRNPEGDGRVLTHQTAAKCESTTSTAAEFIGESRASVEGTKIAGRNNTPLHNIDAGDRQRCLSSTSAARHDGGPLAS